MPNIPPKILRLTILLISTLFFSFSNFLNADTLERPIFSAVGAKMSAGSSTLIYSFGQPFVSTTPSALRIGFLPPQKTESPCLVMLEEKWACVQFQNLNPSYKVGEKIIVDLVENVQATSRFNRVDLWVAIQIPNGDFYFRTPLVLDPFSPIPQAFKASIEDVDAKHHLLEWDLIPGLGGEYTFYALYVDEGMDLIEYLNENKLEEIQRSNLAIQKTTLANE